jgi:hypothetical protein
VGVFTTELVHVLKSMNSLPVTAPEENLLAAPLNVCFWPLADIKRCLLARLLSGEKQTRCARFEPFEAVIKHDNAVIRGAFKSVVRFPSVVERFSVCQR